MSENIKIDFLPTAPNTDYSVVEINGNPYRYRMGAAVGKLIAKIVNGERADDILEPLEKTPKGPTW